SSLSAVNSSSSASLSSRQDRSTSRPLTRATSASRAMRPPRSLATSATVVPRGYSRTAPSGSRTATRWATACSSAMAITLLAKGLAKGPLSPPIPRHVTPGLPPQKTDSHPSRDESPALAVPPGLAARARGAAPPTSCGDNGADRPGLLRRPRKHRGGGFPKAHPFGRRLGGGFPELRRPALPAQGAGSLGGGHRPVLVLRIACDEQDCGAIGFIIGSAPVGVN